MAWSDDAEAVLAADVDVIVELAGGLEPAGGWVRAALTAGKSVVTANKKLIAFHGVELERRAAARGGHLKYGAAVAGGIPVIPGLEQGLAGDRIVRIEGILNGTCNFILSKMEEGAEYAPVLAEAQALGYAEADPTEDVGGFDARAKLSILMRLALRVAVNPEEIVPRAITLIAAVDFSYARELGCTIRQVARAELADGPGGGQGGTDACGLRSPLAYSRGTENMVILNGRYGGDVVFTRPRRGRPSDGGGRGQRPAGAGAWLAPGRASGNPVAGEGGFEVPHYIRFLVNDRPGSSQKSPGRWRRKSINIRAIVQKPGYPQHSLPFVITVEPCTSSGAQPRARRHPRQDYLLEEPLDLQMLEQ